MKLTDLLARDNEEIERRRRFRPDTDDGEEETMTYKDRQPVRYLNAAPGTFDSKLRTGINSDGNIFDRTAVFRTGTGDDSR